MRLSDLTDLADMELDALVALLRERMLSGRSGDACGDAALAVMECHVGSYMLSSCAKLASQLHWSHGLEIVMLEARKDDGSGWSFVHAALSASPLPEILRAVGASDRGLSMHVLDAVGVGPMSDRLALYRADREYRVVPAGDCDAPYPFGRIRGSGDRGPAPMRHDPSVSIPAVALFAGRPFDLASALRSIRGGVTRNGLVHVGEIPGYLELARALADDEPWSERTTRPAGI